MNTTQKGNITVWEQTECKHVNIHGGTGKHKCKSMAK